MNNFKPSMFVLWWVWVLYSSLCITHLSSSVMGRDQEPWVSYHLARSTHFSSSCEPIYGVAKSFSLHKGLCLGNMCLQVPTLLLCVVHPVILPCRTFSWLLLLTFICRLNIILMVCLPTPCQVRRRTTLLQPIVFYTSHNLMFIWLLGSQIILSIALLITYMWELRITIARLNIWCSHPQLCELFEVLHNCLS